MTAVHHDNDVSIDHFIHMLLAFLY